MELADGRFRLLLLVGDTAAAQGTHNHKKEDSAVRSLLHVQHLGGGKPSPSLGRVVCATEGKQLRGSVCVLQQEAKIARRNVVHKTRLAHPRANRVQSDLCVPSVAVARW